MLSCILFGVSAQQNRLYTKEDGISNTSFFQLTHQKNGRIWISTGLGINRFDGYTFDNFFNHPQDTCSVSSCLSRTVFEDSQGRIWVGTLNGLNRFNDELDNFIRIPLQFPDPYKAVFSIAEDKHGKLWLGTSIGLISLDPDKNKQTFHPLGNQPNEREQVNAIIFDRNGNLWAGTEGNGLKSYNPENGHVRIYKAGSKEANALRDNTIHTLCEERSGRIIIGTLKGGISVIDPATEEIKNIPFYNLPGNTFNSAVRSILQDSKGTIWVGTEQNGLKILNAENCTLADANHIIEGYNVRDSKIICYEDNDHNLWFAIDYLGIYLKKNHIKPFHSVHKNTYGSSLKLSNNLVKAILMDRHSNLWVGTSGGGLHYRAKGQNSFAVLKNEPGNNRSLPDNSVTSLYEDPEGNIWVGTYLKGLCLINEERTAFENFLPDPAQSRPLSNFIRGIAASGANRLWVAAADGGMYAFDIREKKFTKINRLQVGGRQVDLPAWIFTIYTDKKNGLWISGGQGLLYCNPSQNKIKEYSIANHQIKSNVVYDMQEDSRENMWIGTSEALYQLNKAGEIVQEYTTEDGLPSNVIYGILEGNHHELWISTLNGLSKFDPAKKSFHNYSSRDGLLSSEFRPGSKYKAADGKLFFGTTQGYIYFDPDSIIDNRVKSELIFTNLKIFNETVKAGKTTGNDLVLNKVLDKSDQIELSYTQNNFTIEFSGIDYTAPENIKYAYQLEGVDKDWVLSDWHQRSVTYSNLNPGRYTFRVKCSNSDGVWMDNTRSLKITITPPFWKSNQAYWLYIILISVFLYYIRKVILFRIRMKHQLQVERIEREKLKELQQAKMQFFTNASHELKTPLSLILGPSASLVHAEEDPRRKKHAYTIYKNAQRMLRLTDQLLDLQKIQENEIGIRIQQVEFISFLQDILSSFGDLAESKKISLKFQSEEKELTGGLDPDHMEKVLFNLLSNAFKFTPAGGSISVHVSRFIQPSLNGSPADHVRITVADTGKGISGKHIRKIFDRFYQAEDDAQFGSGIGLHLVKKLVDLHQGEITVESTEGKGSTFTMAIPLKQVSEHHSYTPKDKITDEPEAINIEALDDEGEGKAGQHPYTLLIVEDDQEIMNYLRSEYSDKYNILTAANGKEGLQVALEQTPDLIISDVMMPEMDGAEMCRQIKSSISTCHIPVILLTAKSDIEHRLNGFEMGADDYISKPFHPQHLSLRVSKLIEGRQMLKQKFAQGEAIAIKEMTLMSADQKFLEKAIDYVKENLSDPDISIEEMGKHMNMSRVHLYRKIKALTDQSPSEFVRTIRLKQAAYLLSQNKLNKSEVAYLAGFSSPQYFSSCFQKFYKMSPSEYCERCKTKAE